MPCSTAERVPGAVIQACLPALPQRRQHALTRWVLGTVLGGFSQLRPTSGCAPNLPSTLHF
jgi:hypothetical protein